MRQVIYALLIIVVASMLITVSADKVAVYKIEQSFDDGESYQLRNELEIRLTGKKMSIKSLPSTSYTLPEDLTKKFFNMPLTSSSSSSKSGFYILRFTKTSMNGADVTSSSEASLVTSVRACALVAAKFKEVLRLHLDKTGELMGINYVMPKSGLDCPSAQVVTKSETITFQTKFVANLPDDVEPLPDTIKAFDVNAAINAANQAKDQGDGFFGGGGSSSGSPAPAPSDESPKDGEGKEQAKPESILMKYWYVFLPAFLMMLINPAVPEEPQQGADGRRVAPASADGASAASAAAGAAAAGAAAVAGAGAKKRR